MSAKIIKRCIDLRLKLALCSSGSIIIIYNQETYQFQPSSIIARLHTKFLSMCGVIYIATMSYFLWKTIEFSDYQVFAGNMLGVAEVVTVLLTISMKRRVLNFCKEFCDNLNEHFKLLERIEELRRQAYITPSASPFKAVEWLVAAVAIVPAFFSLAFIPATCVTLEPNHRFCLHVFDTNISLRLQFLHFFIAVFVSVMDLSTLIFMVVTGELLHIMIVPYVFIGLSAEQTQARKIINEGNVIRVSYKLDTVSFGILEEDEVIVLARQMHVLNNRQNFVYACLEISSHHVVMLVIFVCTSFMFIRAWKTLFLAGYVVISLAIVGILVGLVVEHIESLYIGTLASASNHFVTKGKALFVPRSVYERFIKSYPKYLTFKIAHPFYNITNATFLEFLDQCFNFLVALLTFDV